MTRLFVSKRRSRAANDYSRVILAQEGIQCLFVSKRRSRAANDYSGVIPAPDKGARGQAPAGIHCPFASKKRRRRAANDCSRVIDAPDGNTRGQVAVGIQCRFPDPRLVSNVAGFPISRERHRWGGGR